MKNKLHNAALAALLLVFALIPAGCGEGVPDSPVFDAKLRGTWETNSPGPLAYRGKLVIGRNSITISGYERILPLNDPQRPFWDITKNIARRGYTEDGIMYINDFGWKEGIPYQYEGGGYPGYVKLLRFTFAGRDETLRKIED
jgi:hypothetical protein